MKYWEHIYELFYKRFIKKILFECFSLCKGKQVGQIMDNFIYKMRRTLNLERRVQGVWGRNFDLHIHYTKFSNLGEGIIAVRLKAHFHNIIFIQFIQSNRKNYSHRKIFVLKKYFQSF